MTLVTVIEALTIVIVVQVVTLLTLEEEEESYPISYIRQKIFCMYIRLSVFYALDSGMLPCLHPTL